MKKIFLLFVVCCVLIVTVPSFAAETPYTLLAPIPLEGAGAGDAQTTVASQYIRGVFMLIIGLATGLAVIMIIYGGIKYMSTDAFTGKSEARETIQNAIWGLLLVIAAWLILYTINPKLVEFNLNIPISSMTTQKAATFLANANSVGGLGVLVEVTSAAKKTAMTQAGIPENQVKVTAGNGDHFHVKLQ